MYNSKYHLVLSIYRAYTSWFTKHKLNIDMTDNYVLLGRLH